MPHIEPPSLSIRTAPYVPFPTFLTALDRLSPKAPDVIDRDLFPSFSGAVQSQILVAFRFLVLIDRDKKTQPPLGLLIESPEDRKDVLKILLKDSYAEVFMLDLERASARQLDAAIEHYNVSGATLRKAVSFFVKAAQFCGISLSPFITGRKGRSGRRKNGTRGRNPAASESSNPMSPAPDATQTDSSEQKSSRTLKLETGNGEVALSVKFDPFTISTSDRDYIFGLVDQLSAYADRRPKQSSTVPPKAQVNPFKGMEVTDDDVPF